MQYPFAVITHVGDHAATTHHRGAVSAENAAVSALRAGIERVDVRYLRHPVATFTPADMATVIPGDTATFLIRRIEAGVLALGPHPSALPRGRRRQSAVAVLVESLGMSGADASKAVAALHEYLR